ncbi:hypothetical protein MMC10_006703 [Thelotrema lepadinum]|nr:hypothetical protein [Thelotrema lepadinum]
MSNFRYLAIAALIAAVAAESGTGTTTRYWDCCKPSCAWNDLSSLGIESSVKTCDVNDQPLSTNDDQSGCNGGNAYMCSDQSPWQVNDNLAYGFAAVSAASSACCQCYELTFTSTAIAGKKMVVQATNTGSDVSSTQFDLAMPGGGFGIFDGCSTEWNATSDVWGQQYGGPSTDTCGQFPCALQPGCGFRWGSFFQGADNPTVSYQTVACPTEITDKSGCTRTGDTPTAGIAAAAPASPTGVCSGSGSPAPSSSTAAPVASSSSTAAPVASSSSQAGSSPSASASSPAPVSPSASASSTDLASMPLSSLVSTISSASSTAAAQASSTTSSAEPEETGDDECDAGLDL